MKFQLEPYTTPSSRYHCPQCNDRNKTFVRYISTETGEHLADHVGRCSRENNCGYHYKPGQFFEAQGGWRRAQGVSDRRLFRPKKKTPIATRQTQTQPKTCIRPEIVNATFAGYGRNNFVQYLISTFGLDIADELTGRYRIGTARHWPGATVFWQIDTNGLVRTGKVMLYDKATGKRVKQPFSHITWAHTLLSGSCSGSSSYANVQNTATATATFNLKQCLFGEHLLKEHPNRGVAIVESEKTAIIASACNEAYTWLASGSLSNLNAELCQSLKGRHVTLYPDLGAYDKWKAKALQLQLNIPGSIFTVSDMLERLANETDRQKGLDLGDFL